VKYQPVRLRLSAVSQQCFSLIKNQPAALSTRQISLNEQVVRATHALKKLIVYMIGSFGNTVLAMHVFGKKNDRFLRRRSKKYDRG
jgi:hypothetical protein